MEDQHTHHHQAPPHAGPGNPVDDVRPAYVFNGYNAGYPGADPSGSAAPSLHDTLSGPPHPHHPHHPGGAIAAARQGSPSRGAEEPEDLFPDIPEAKKRKFILVEDSDRQSRLRVRVTLDGVDTREIPDSFRKGSSVYPRSYFPREMQSPPPSATGSRFFQDDDAEDDGSVDTEGRRPAGAAAHSGRAAAKMLVKVPMGDGSEGEVAIPRMRHGARAKEVRLNDLGYRMAWLQSRVFAGRTVFLQRARKFRSHESSRLTGEPADIRSGLLPE